MDGPAILRRWFLAAPSTRTSAVPAAVVVGSAAEWGQLRARWELPADALPDGACDFAVARCLFVVADAAAPLAATWGTEEGVDVLTLVAANPPAGETVGVHAFVLLRRAAQLAVVYRPVVGGESPVWVDPGRN